MPTSMGCIDSPWSRASIGFITRLFHQDCSELGMPVKRAAAPVSSPLLVPPSFTPSQHPFTRDDSFGLG